jgi:hypothetical protein
MIKDWRADESKCSRRSLIKYLIYIAIIIIAIIIIGIGIIIYNLICWKHINPSINAMRAPRIFVCFI